jgi:hypothetical protein
MDPAMKDDTSNSSESHIDVRFSKFFAIIIILMSHAPLIFALEQIISLKREIFQGTNFIVPSIAILVGLLFILTGISHPNRWHFRLDRDNRMLMVSYGIGSWSKKYPYDTIFYAGEKFHIERSGVKKTIGLMKFFCNKRDLNLLVLALDESS